MRVKKFIPFFSPVISVKESGNTFILLLGYKRKYGQFTRLYWHLERISKNAKTTLKCNKVVTFYLVRTNGEKQPRKDNRSGLVKTALFALLQRTQTTGKVRQPERIEKAGKGRKGRKDYF